MRTSFRIGIRDAALLLAILATGCTVACARSGNREAGETGAPAPTSATRAPNVLTAPTAQAVPAPTPAATPPPVPVASGFEPLLGRWLRPDGGYILEVTAVAPDGTAVASYLNPRPIHVERARAVHEGETLALFVELKDANYPGSTYRLVYVPARDVLEGTYFQAMQRQTFDVAFVRR